MKIDGVRALYIVLRHGEISAHLVRTKRPDAQSVGGRKPTSAAPADARTLSDSPVSSPEGSDTSSSSSSSPSSGPTRERIIREVPCRTNIVVAQINISRRETTSARRKVQMALGAEVVQLRRGCQSITLPGPGQSRILLELTTSHASGSYGSHGCNPRFFIIISRPPCS